MILLTSSFGNNKADKQVFFKIAEKINPDLDKFKTDYDSEICRLKIKEDINEATKLNIEGTPSVFLNGHLGRNLQPDNLDFLIRYLSK